MEDEWAEIAREEATLSRTELHGLSSRPLSVNSERLSDHLSESSGAPQPASDTDAGHLKSAIPNPNPNPTSTPAPAGFSKPAKLAFSKPSASKSHGSMRKEASIEELVVAEKPRAGTKPRTLGTVLNQASNGSANAAAAHATTTAAVATAAAGTKGDVSINIVSSKEKVRSQRRQKLEAKQSDKVETSFEKTELKITFGKEAPKSGADPNPNPNQSAPAPAKASNGVTPAPAAETMHSSHSSQTLIIQNRAVNSQIVVRNTVTENRAPLISKAGGQSSEQSVIPAGGTVESPIRKLDATRPILSEPLGPGIYGPAELGMICPVTQSVQADKPLKVATSNTIALGPARPTTITAATSSHAGANPVAKVGPGHIPHPPTPTHRRRPSNLPVKVSDNVCGRYGAIICTIL